ncbi:MAG: hypothetical protein MUC75_03830 [Ignavibacteriaceae bacterium]|nr:hypothetical protein [Ignavibacteriaceae bacterium]
MKTLLITLTAFSLALIIGCQESMLNEPSQTMLKPKSDLVHTNIINMNYDVKDPLYGASKVIGEVAYTHEVLIQPMGPIGFKRISLQLSLNSELENLLGMSPIKWSVSGKSQDVVTVSEEGILLIEKCYWIANRYDVVLLVQYMVTTDGVGISGVSLAPLEK